MKLNLSRLSVALLLAMGAGTAHAQASLTGGTYSQNFDSLSNTAGSTTNSTLPTGWLLTESGGSARDNEQYAVDTGSGNTGDTYSYGAAGATDRAFGSLRSGTLIPVIGACFSNATGNTLTSFDIAYTGEQWRLGTAARTDRLDFQYSLNATSLTDGTWVDVDALDFSTPDTATTGAKNGNAAATRTAISSSVTGVSIPNSNTFCIRWNDSDATGADDGLAIDDFSMTVAGTTVPVLSINDVTQAEGNSGTTNFTFTVSLSSPAPAGGVTFDIATSDGTATTANSDYVAKSLTAQTIPAGSSTYSFTVAVNGDTTPETNESFNVSVTNVVGATVGDASGLGTIQNDDGALIVPINLIQGSGSQSPYKDQTLTTEGVVTVARSGSFFIQSLAVAGGSRPARDDGNPATSDGILVFSPLPAGMGVGDVVQVTGKVIEYMPVANTFPVTEFQSASNIVKVSDAPVPLPAAKELTAADFSAALLSPDVLEHLEGMYVHIASGKIVSPTRFSGATANEFEIVVDGVQRPMREEGVSIFDNYVFPRVFSPVWFDANQERIKLYPATGTPPQVDARGTVSNAYGALTYYGTSTAENSWQLYYDPATITIASGTPAPVSAQGINDVTIAGYNLEWFGSGSESEYGPFADRIAKAGAVICDWLKAPDILGTVEVDGNPGSAAAALQPLADYINANCASAPNYVAYMLGTGDQSLGFLVKTSLVGGVPRVQLQDVDPAAGTQPVQQHGAATLQMKADPSDLAKLRPYPFSDHVANPSHESDKLLNDRPPLRLKAVVNFADGRKYPVTVIAVHQKALGDNTNTASSPLGYKDYGAQSRAKRAEQAYELAQLVKDAQLGILTGTSAGEKVVIVGDFNSFGFNDGYVDAMGITTGHPAPDAEVLLPYPSPLTAADGLVVDDDDTYNFIADPQERYSYNFDSINQALDHVLLSQSLLADTAIFDIDVQHARVNADFRTNLQKVFNAPYNMTTNLPVRTSDHDPVRVSISVKPDNKAPTLAPVLPSPILKGGSYTVLPNAADENGIASASCSPTPLDTSTTGTKTLVCTATDKAGNTNTVTLDYTVTTTCANDGYTGTKLSWCREICEAGNSGLALNAWILRWTQKYRPEMPYCLVNPQPAPVPTLH